MHEAVFNSLPFVYELSRDFMPAVRRLEGYENICCGDIWNSARISEELFFRPWLQRYRCPLRDIWIRSRWLQIPQTLFTRTFLWHNFSFEPFKRKTHSCYSEHFVVSQPNRFPNGRIPRLFLVLQTIAGASVAWISVWSPAFPHLVVEYQEQHQPSQQPENFFDRIFPFCSESSVLRRCFGKQHLRWLKKIEWIGKIIHFDLLSGYQSFPCGTNLAFFSSHELRSKELSLEMLLLIVQNSSSLLHTSQPFILALRHYLCVSLSRNGVSPIVSIFEKSLAIFVQLVNKFKMHLKMQIEVCWIAICFVIHIRKLIMLRQRHLYSVFVPVRTSFSIR